MRYLRLLAGEVGCQVRAMNAARVRSEPTLLNSTTEAISRCPCRYWTAKITAATGAGSAFARTARRRSVCDMPIAARITHSSAGTTTFRMATAPTTKRLTAMRCANSTIPLANNATPVVADPSSFIAATSTCGIWTPATTSSSARTGAHTTGSFTAERTCCRRLPRAASGGVGDGSAFDAGVARACVAVTVWPAPPAAKAGRSGCGSRSDGKQYERDGNLDDVKHQSSDGNRNRAQGRPVQVTEHQDARERDGRGADRKRGKRRHTKRPVQRESDDQERHQIRAEHPRGDRSGQMRVVKWFGPTCRREFWPRCWAGLAAGGGAGRRWFLRRGRRVDGRPFAGRPGCSTAGCGRVREAGGAAAGRIGRSGGGAYRHAPAAWLRAVRRAWLVVVLVASR